MKLKQIATAALAALLVLPAAAAPFRLVSGKVRASVTVGKGEPEYVYLAARDMVSDVEAITGVKLELRRARSPKKGGVFIATKSGDNRWEAYEVGVAGGTLRISGSSPRGTMFAVYDFVEKYLGVDPLSFWDDSAYPSAESLEWEDVSIVQDSPDCRFRGWFINDEDFLTGWKPSGQKRCLDYGFFENVISPEVMEHIAEAAVRCRFNMIIPSSFIWIQNPPEEELVKICSRRGLFITMHHQEPLGLSGRFFEKYWKDRGRDIPYSYVSSKEVMDSMWRQSVEGWKKYPDIIWTIGLRGVGDKALWKTDSKAPESMEARGKLISDAMARQIEILDEAGVPREGRLCETTLWLEGARLNAEGFLIFPEGTLINFADNGPGWRWTSDFYNNPRLPEYTYGVYYHPALFYDGPHLAPLVPVSRTYACIKEAKDRNSFESVLINVGNIREFTYNISAVGQMLWNTDSFSPETWQDSWVEKHFSDNPHPWQNAYRAYFNCLQLHPSAGLPMFLDGYLWGSCRDLLRDIASMLENGVKPEDSAQQFVTTIPDSPEPTRFARRAGSRFNSTFDQYTRLCAQKASYELVLQKVEAEYARLPEEQKPFAFSGIVHPSRLMFNLTSFCAELAAAKHAVSFGDNAAAKARLDTAKKYLSAIWADRAEYASGKWEHWYDINRFDFGKLDKSLSDIMNKI